MRGTRRRLQIPFKGICFLCRYLWKYILNKLPQKKLDKTPNELWKGRTPSYQFLKVWGCLAKVAVPILKKVKIGPKTVNCVFIGYAYNSSAYRFFIHKSDIPDMHVNTIIESRNALFF